MQFRPRNTLNDRGGRQASYLAGTKARSIILCSVEGATALCDEHSATPDLPQWSPDSAKHSGSQRRPPNCCRNNVLGRRLLEQGVFAEGFWKRDSALERKFFDPSCFRYNDLRARVAGEAQPYTAPSAGCVLRPCACRPTRLQISRLHCWGRFLVRKCRRPIGKRTVGARCVVVLELAACDLTSVVGLCVDRSARKVHVQAWTARCDPGFENRSPKW